ncbi:MAG TPA: hypothetical protein VMW12_00515 [Candidatus Dormibacteraeota bacterium]|nr:hypothetical protein [Candidatus Dormibacteraeota bacterium]
MPSRINRIKQIVAFLGVLAMTATVARAQMPSVADLDAHSRASGNRIDLAQRVGDSIFRTTWNAQVIHVSANSADGHTVIGLALSGVKFHAAITRAQFVAEIVDLVRRSFAAAPQAGEVDLWADVPIPVFKGEIVSGDLAKPAWRNVFTISARRGESTAKLVQRIDRGDGVFWDQEWAKTAFKQGT